MFIAWGGPGAATVVYEADKAYVLNRDATLDIQIRWIIRFIADMLLHPETLQLVYVEPEGYGLPATELLQDAFIRAKDNGDLVYVPRITEVLRVTVR